MAVLPLRRTNGGHIQGALVLASTEAEEFDENQDIFWTSYLNFLPLLPWKNENVVKLDNHLMNYLMNILRPAK